MVGVCTGSCLGCALVEVWGVHWFLLEDVNVHVNDTIF